MRKLFRLIKLLCLATSFLSLILIYFVLYGDKTKHQVYFDRLLAKRDFSEQRILPKIELNISEKGKPEVVNSHLQVHNIIKAKIENVKESGIINIKGNTIQSNNSILNNTSEHIIITVDSGGDVACPMRCPYWRQYQKARQITPNIASLKLPKDIPGRKFYATKPPSQIQEKYKYDIKHNWDPTRPNSLSLTISEECDGSIGTGGTNFRVEYRSQSVLTLCMVEDAGNGTYTVRCQFDSACPTVTVYLMFIRYQAYVDYWNNMPMNKRIWEKSFCSGERDDFNLDAYPVCHSINPRGKVMWAKGRNDTEYNHVLVDKCKVGEKNYDYIKSCLSRFASFNLIGDSHSRLNYLYLLDKLKLFTPKDLRTKNPSYQMENILYRAAGFSNETKLHLEYVINKVKNVSGKHIVIINNGDWDLMFQNSEKYVTDFMKYVIPVVKVWREKYKEHTKMIWLSIGGYPDQQTKRGRRNNYLNTAFNSWIKCQLESLGVDMFTIRYDITDIRNNMNVCTDHYLCNDDQIKFSGIAGMRVVDALLTYVCDTIP